MQMTFEAAIQGSVAIFTHVCLLIPHSLKKNVEAKSVVGVVLEAPEPVREEVHERAGSIVSPYQTQCCNIRASKHPS